jgi:hypothetical protein
MTTKLGPVLIFGAATADQWALRALYVFSGAGAKLPSLVYDDGITKTKKADAVRLLEYGDHVVCAYDLEFARGAKTTARRYALERAVKQKTFVPAKAETPHLAYASCAGF